MSSLTIAHLHGAVIRLPRDRLVDGMEQTREPIGFGGWGTRVHYPAKAHKAGCSFLSVSHDSPRSWNKYREIAVLTNSPSRFPYHPDITIKLVSPNKVGWQTSRTSARDEQPLAYDTVVSDFDNMLETPETGAEPQPTADSVVESDFDTDTASETSETSTQPEPTANDVLIAVMGLTGSGKSTFINLATQSKKKLRVGHSITSCTDAVDIAGPFELDGRRVFLFDTPGFDDTNKGQLEILRIIASTLETQFRAGVKLHGVIYVHRISDIRVGGVAKSNFHIFRKICGDDSLKNVVIVTTMWSEVSEARGQRRVRELESLDDFFKPALAKRAVMMHHKHNTVQSARGIIRKILDNHPLPLALQTELVVKKKSIEQTSASQEVEQNVAVLRAEYEQRLREQRAALEQAIKDKDKETRKELAEETAKAQAQINKLRADQASHTADYKRLRARVYAAEEERRRAEERQREAERQKKAEHRRAAERQMEAVRQRAAQQHWAAAVYSNPSGKTYTLFNKKHEYYATLDRDERRIVAEAKSLSSRQQWIFTKHDGYWTIKSAKTKQYMSLTSDGRLRARSSTIYWKMVHIIGTSNEFRICASGEWNERTIALTKGVRSKKLQVVKRRKNLRDEVWIIEKCWW